MAEEKKKVINTVQPGVTKFQPAVYDDTDEQDIDATLKSELAEQNLEYRFIDFKKAKLNGGRSRSGWIVYKRRSPDPRLAGIESLADPDGLVRQGSMVLAVKTLQAATRQRARRDAQNTTLKKYTQTAAQEVDQDARRKLGGSSRAIVGYEKN